jgi:hypothetical protein
MQQSEWRIREQKWILSATATEAKVINNTKLELQHTLSK